MKKTKQTKHKPSTRLLTLLLVCTMVFTMMPGVVWADGGSAVSEADNVTEISLQEDLAKIGGVPSGKYKLTADITLDDSWKEIDPRNEFTLDGNGHSITLTGKPLIGTVMEKGTTVSNLVVRGEVEEPGNTNVGALARSYAGTVRNCSFGVNVTYKGNGDKIGVGGIAGILKGTVSNCVVTGKITNGKSNLFGTVGNSGEFDTTGTIKNVVAVGCAQLGMKEGTDYSSTKFDTTFTPISGTDCKLIENADEFDPTAYVDKMNANRDVGEGDLEWKVVGNLLVPVAADGGEAPEVDATEKEITALATAITAAEAVDKTKVYTAETWEAFSTALENAKKVKNAETPLKKAVTSATTKLTEAIDELVERQISAVDFSGKTVKLIKTADELAELESGKYYKLANDITIEGIYFGTYSPMNAKIDGNGHTITLNGAPLWQKIGKDAVVQNLGIKGKLDQTSANGAIAKDCEGLIVNCWSLADLKIQNKKDAGGFVVNLKSGGAIGNSYVAGKFEAEGTKGAIAARSEANSAVNNCYWMNTVCKKAVGEGNGVVNASAAKERKDFYSTDFIALLNTNKGDFGKTWAVSEDGFPYFGENHNYVPEGEGALPANRTAIAFTPNEGTLSTIANQALTVDLNKTNAFGVVGTFSLPEYTTPEGGSIEWSCTAQNPEKTGSISEADGKFFIEKEGTLIVKATLKTADEKTEVLASVKVTVIKSEVKEIKICLADDKGENAVAIENGKATIQGSEWKTVVAKAELSTGEYYQLQSKYWNLEFTNGEENIIRISEDGRVIQFSKPSTATVKVTYKDNKSLSDTAEITSEYVPLTSLKPGISGTITIHGRNANSDGGKDFNATYAGVIPTPSNASACHYNTKYTITSSDKTVAEYVDYLVKGYVPYKAGKVTYTASVEDNDKTISGSSNVEYVYKNPLKSITVNNNRLTVKANQSIPAGLVFHGTLNDGHEVSDTTMEWTYSKDGIVTIERENGGFKRDESAPDNNQYFLSSEYTIRGLEEGTVTVTGTPVDKTGGAGAVSFVVTVEQGEAEKPVDSEKLITDGLTDAKNFWKSKSAKEMASFGNEWYFFTLSRAGVSIDSKAVEDYLTSVAKAYTTDLASDNANKTKPTTIARTILAVGALGKDPANVGGANLLAMLYNSDKISDGGNEAMWALIALDSGKYAVSNDAKWTRNGLVDEILAYQSKDEKGFSWSGKGAKADIDGTAMAIQALAPYYSVEKVKTAVDEALVYLQGKMNSNCQFGSSEAGAQVLIALTSLGKDPLNQDNGFVKSVARNLVTGLDAYRIESKGFKHMLTDSTPNAMATQQALLALESCRRLKAREASIYDITDFNARKTLEKRVAEAEALKEDYYKADLWKTMVEAKNAAKAVLEKADATDEGLKAADKALADALAALYAYNPKPGVAADDIIVNITIAEQGKLAVGTQKDGKHQGEAIAIAAVPITVQDRNKDGTQDIDEVLYAIHERYYAGGAKSGYKCDTNGLLKTLWGKDASVSGIWKNNVSASTGLKDTVNAGDNVSVFTYKDTKNWSDKFTKFDKNEYKVTAGEDVNMSLEAAGFDDKWQTVWKPAGSVTISLLNGRVLGTTDAEGNAKISGLAQGTHKLVASTADGLTVPAVATIVVKDPQAAQDKVSMRVADPKGKTYLPKTSYDFVSGETVYSLLTKSGLRYEAKYYGMYGGYYVQKIEGLGEFDKGAKSGWMYRVNGVYPEVSCSEYKLRAGDDVEWLYTTDLGKDIGASSEQKTDVTTSGAAGSGTTTAPTEVAVTEKTNADGAKEIVAAVTVKKENQTEILKQAKENRSKEIVLTVAAAASKGADSIQLELPKDMVSDIVRNTQAEVTVDAEHGALTLDRETLAQIAKEAKGSALTLTIHKAKIATEAQQKLTGAATQVYRLTLASANQNISQFDGRITVKLPIPAMLLEKTVAAVHFDSAEKFTQMQGKRESRSKQDFYVFATTHFSEFGLVDAEEAGITEKDAQEPETDKLSDRKEAKKIVSKMRLTTTASKTKQQSVKLQMKQSKKTRKDIKALQSLGYNVKYRFFRSTKKSKGYRRLTTKNTNAYTSVKGKKGTRYYYKTQLCVYDKEGKLIAKTALKQSKYAEKVWTKKAKA